MREAPEPGQVYPHILSNKRLLLEENSKEIHRRILNVEKRLRNTRWEGRLFEWGASIVWARGLWFPWAVVLGAVPPLISFGQTAGSPELSIILGISLALLAGKMMDQGATLFRQEKERWQGKQEISVSRNVSRILWSASFGHLPGMNDQRASTLSHDISRASPRISKSVMSSLQKLRLQYDSDLVGAAIKSNRPSPFFHKDWLLGGEMRDSMGMTPLCCAVDNLDLSQIQKLVDDGARMDVVARPYGVATPVTLLRIAMAADGAVKTKVRNSGVLAAVAREQLSEERLRVFTTLLELDPDLWFNCQYNGYSLADHGAAGNPQAEMIVEAMRTRQKLKNHLVTKDEATTIRRM